MNIFPLLFILGSTLMVSGCQNLRPLPEIDVVKVPVVRSCVEYVPEKPAFAVDALPIEAGIFEQMRALRIERYQRKIYEMELEEVIEGCR